MKTRFKISNHGKKRQFGRPLLLERLEQRTVLSSTMDLAAAVSAGDTFQAAVDTPPVVVGAGVPDVTVNEDAADTFIRMHDWFDDQPLGPAGLTFAIQSVNPPATPVFSLMAFETGMADTRTAFTMTRLTSDKVLVTGGFYYDGSEPITLDSAELYDPMSQTWTLVTPMHLTRQDHEATLLADGRVLVTGGGTGGGLTASAEIYNPVANTCTLVNPMSVVRVQHTATILPSGRVLVVGGLGSDATTSAELYDPSTNTWSPAGSLSTWRWAHTATALADGSVLVVGGIDVNSELLASAERYDPASNTWSDAGTIAVGRQNHAATLLLDGNVLVTAGSDTAGALNDVELYNPASNSWTTRAPLAEARLWHSATLLSDGRVLVVGGNPVTGPTVDTAELYNPLTNLWSPTDAVANARSQQSAMLLTDGSVLIAGGLDFSHGFPPDTLSSSELFHPSVSQWTLTAPVLRLGYAKDEFGMAQITIRATDLQGAFVDDTFQVTVNPVNDGPSFDPGLDQVATDENPLTHGPALEQTVVGWAMNISKGPANEADQTLSFLVTNDNNALFTQDGQPAIDEFGTLAYTPAANTHGFAHVTVRLGDSGGIEFGGQNTSGAETFQITITKPMVRHNTAPAANPLAVGLDVTNSFLGAPDGYIAPEDALAVINHINAFNSHQFTSLDYGPPYFDTDADMWCAPGDALSIINYINAFGAGATGEGEAAVQPLASEAADAMFQQLGSRSESNAIDHASDELLLQLLADTVNEVLIRNRRR